MQGPNHAGGFSTEVIAALRHYVYRLIDPRNGETFYVGKGAGNRVFAHCRDELGAQASIESEKLLRIREIRLAGLEVAHVIHRHGMDEATAFEVEAALIDAYPGLTNEVIGHDGEEFGSMHAQEIIRRYAAASATFDHRAVLINVNQSALSHSSLYDATRFAWKINPDKARAAEVVLGVVRGIIRGAFVADQWLEANPVNFPGRPEMPGRWGFIGAVAPADLVKHYVHKRVPDTYRKPGAANPIRYTWQ